MIGDVKYTLESVIDNMKWFISNYGKATRKEYRDAQGKGALPESVWGKYFPTWRAFVEAANGPELKQAEAEKYTFTDNKGEIFLPKTTIHTLDELLEYCKVDLSLWEVERFTVNKWEMGYATGPKNERVAESKELYQVKATLVKRQAVVDARNEIERLKKELKKEAPYRKKVYPKLDVLSGNMLEINVPDVHFGKMAWGKETGDRSYDTPIAAATFLRAVGNLTEMAKGFNINKILFVVGNDLLNSDDEQGRTTKGTFVTTDGRYQKTFLTVRKTITEAIKGLSEIAPVEVLMVSGNHDNLGVWHLGDSLECLFENDEDVTVRNEPTQRKYVRFGEVLLGFTHGDKGKREDFPLLMATERPKDFGETKYREIHTGHVHQTKLQEWHGIRVRILPSLSPPDAWHSENGFTGQQRNAEAYVWNQKHGLIAMFFHNDDSFPVLESQSGVVGAA